MSSTGSEGGRSPSYAKNPHRSPIEREHLDYNYNDDNENLHTQVPGEVIGQRKGGLHREPLHVEPASEERGGDQEGERGDHHQLERKQQEEQCRAGEQEE